MAKRKREGNDLWFEIILPKGWNVLIDVHYNESYNNKIVLIVSRKVSIRGVCKVWRGGSAPCQDSSLFEEEWEERALKNKKPGGTPLYRPYRYVPLQGSENGYRLYPFWSGIEYGFAEIYRNVWKYLLVQFQTNKKEREIWEFEMDLRIFFVCVLFIGGQVWEKWNFLVWNRARIWRTRQHIRIPRSTI